MKERLQAFKSLKTKEIVKMYTRLELLEMYNQNLNSKGFVGYTGTKESLVQMIWKCKESEWI